MEFSHKLRCRKYKPNKQANIIIRIWRVIACLLSTATDGWKLLRNYLTLLSALIEDWKPIILFAFIFFLRRCSKKHLLHTLHTMYMVCNLVIDLLYLLCISFWSLFIGVKMASVICLYSAPTAIPKIPMFKGKLTIHTICN